MDEADRGNCSVSFRDLITDMKLELQCGERKAVLVELMLERIPHRKSYKFVSLGPSNFFAGHAL